MASAPFLTPRPRPRFGPRHATATAETAGLVVFARCWLAATAFILIWVG